MWWFFRRNYKITEAQDWNHLKNNLEGSFSNIKKDIKKLQKLLEDKSTKHDHQIHELFIKLIKLEGLIEGKSSFTERSLNKKEDKINLDFKDNFDDLTDTQKSILLRLNLLLRESNQEWFPMKYLTQDLYPDKKYENVKSMVSNYTDTLLDLGLIEKKRKGKQILLSITKKGYKCLPKKTESIKLKTKK